jgi:penicillin-binding protein 2
MPFSSWFTQREYRVSVNQEDWVTPEETLIDSSSVHSNLETPIPGGVFRFSGIIIFIIFITILFFSFRLSVLQNANFLELAMQNKTVNFAVSPPRGIIMDRNFEHLVSNIPSFDLLVVSRELGDDISTQRQDIVDMSEILSKPIEEFVLEIQEGVQKNAVFFAAINMTKEQVLEIKQKDFTGFYVIAGTKRQYVDSQQFSNVIGYVGRVNQDDLKFDDYYFPSDKIGRLGIEAVYEKDLRGTHGKVVFTREEDQNINEEPAIGNTVVLNIDYDLQKKLFNEVFNVLYDTELEGAAAIVQDPQNGEVLAMVSFPEFDNNVFNDRVSQTQYERLFESSYRPLFNRVIGGLYNPGSTIKPFIGMAALQEDVIAPSDVIRDCVSITIPNPRDPDDPYVFKNWRSDLGLFNLRRAIANSCNVYFFTIGGGFGDIKGLGINRIAKYLKESFIGSMLGIDLLGENEGFVPDPDWKRDTRDQPWYQGDTYNISIGQGDLLVTPLWINTAVAAIANGGVLYQPLVAREIINEDGNTVRKILTKALGKLPFDPEIIAEMRSDMGETVISGTAKSLQGIGVTVGAKTGTAEVIKDKKINSLFTAFAPLDSPEIVITVLVEGSESNQGQATRVANAVLDWYFNKRIDD